MTSDIIINADYYEPVGVNRDGIHTYAAVIESGKNGSVSIFQLVQSKKKVTR